MTILSAGQDIYLRQGDTGNITFTGIPTDKNYAVYLSVYDPDTENIIKEIEATSFTQAVGTALFTVSEDESNDLRVGEWEYGLKICASGSEDTVLPRMYVDNESNLIQEPAPKFVVLDKYVEGA